MTTRQSSNPPEWITEAGERQLTTLAIENQVRKQLERIRVELAHQRPTA